MVVAPLMGPYDTARAVILYLAPGEFVAEHPAASRQLFCVVAGSGWVSGPDGERVPIGAGRAAAWEAGERHAAGTDDGLTAVVLEGDGFEVAAPPVT
jgi:gentisate 1,2-dioxygenase